MENLRGLGVAIVTPFKDGNVDYDSLTRLLGHLDTKEVDYLVVMGTTGESPTLSRLEKEEVLDFCIANSTKPIVYGLGGNNTAQLVEDLKEIENKKISAILSVTPYYSRPSQEGMIQHFERLADASRFPIILYNVPFRTGVNLNAESTAKLSQHNNIIAVKEASGDLEQCKRIIEASTEDFVVLSGDDVLTLDLIRMGAHGVISVVGNYLPEEFGSMVHMALSGDFDQANDLNTNLTESYELMSAEGNPTSVKTALAVRGICSNEMRLPLISGSMELSSRIEASLKGIKKG